MSDGESKPIPRHKIKVPIPLALGHLEYLTDDELYTHMNDLLAETRRRIELQEQDDD